MHTLAAAWSGGPAVDQYGAEARMMHISALEQSGHRAPSETCIIYFSVGRLKPVPPATVRCSGSVVRAGTRLHDGLAVCLERGTASDRLHPQFPDRGQHADELIDAGSIVLDVPAPRQQRVEGPNAKVLLR